MAQHNTQYATRNTTPHWGHFANNPHWGTLMVAWNPPQNGCNPYERATLIRSATLANANGAIVRDAYWAARPGWHPTLSGLRKQQANGAIGFVIRKGCQVAQNARARLASGRTPHWGPHATQPTHTGQPVA